MRTIETNVVEKNTNTQFMFIFFFRKSYPLWDNVEKYRRARQARGDNIQGYSKWLSGF